MVKLPKFKHLYERDFWGSGWTCYEVAAFYELFGFNVLVWGNSSIYPIYVTREGK